MPEITAEIAADTLQGLLAATAPPDAEAPEARAARERGLRAALAAFAPDGMQEMLLAAEILAAHSIAMARLGDAGRTERGSVKASRLLRDAAAAQRMLLAASRSLRLWRAAAARTAAQQRKEDRRTAPAVGGAARPPVAVPVAAAPLAIVPPPVAAVPRLAPPRLPQAAALFGAAGFAGPLGCRHQGRPDGLIGAAAGLPVGYKAALRSSVALPVA